jgi:predicted nucleotidyltransferase component of viral defense system
MKDYLLQSLQASQTPLQGRNITREYLQARILGVLQRTGAMMPLAFQGGTSLRFLYSIPRYSEDLDFALERETATYDLRAYLRAIRAELSAKGYEVELKVNEKRIVIIFLDIY